MTTSPKLARKRLAKFDRPSVAKMGTVLNSNVAPKFPLSRRTFWSIWPQFAGSPANSLVVQTYRGSRRYQIAQYRLATVLPASLRSCHTHLICRAC